MKILLVDDDIDIRNSLVRTFKLRGYETVQAQSVAEALVCLEDTKNINVIVSDYDMPGMKGLDLWKKLSPEMKKKFILFSGTDRIFDESISFVSKGDHIDVLLKMILAISSS